MSFKTLFAGAAAAALVSAAMATPAAAVVITNGAYSVGVSNHGVLYDAANGGTGFQNGSGYEYMGLRDGWALNGAYADDPDTGVNFNDVTLVSFDPASAVSITQTSEFQVQQAFSFAATNVLAIETTLTNITAGELSGTFLRISDFQVDVDPSEEGARENAMTFGTDFENTTFGYDSIDALSPWSYPCCDLSEIDLGAGLRVNFANLGAGRTFKFTYYYAFGNEGAWGVRDDLLAAGAKGGLIIEDADGSTAGGMGVAIQTPIPEPSTWALMIGGFGLAGGALRRRRLAHA